MKVWSGTCIIEGNYVRRGDNIPDTDWAARALAKYPGLAMEMPDEKPAPPAKKEVNT